jgi:hypothetical protein
VWTPSLTALLSQADLTSPIRSISRYGYRPPGQGDPNRIVSSIRQANYRSPSRYLGSTADDMRRIMESTRRTRSVTRRQLTNFDPRRQLPSHGSSDLSIVRREYRWPKTMSPSPYNSPGARQRFDAIYSAAKKRVVPSLSKVGNRFSMAPSAFNNVATRLGSVARTGYGVTSRLAARVALALGPIGIAIALAAAAAVAIGAVIYYNGLKPNKSNKPVIDTIDDVLDDALPIDQPDKIEPTVPSEVVEDLWAGNVPWKRRPGKDLTFSQILDRSPVLRAFAPMVLK